MNTPGCSLLIRALLRRKQNEGVWGYNARGQFSAEATAFATLACWHSLDSTARDSIVDSLKKRQLPGGSWPSVAGSSSAGNWATAVTAYALALVAPAHSSLGPSLQNLVSATPGEAFWLWRLKFQTVDTRVRFDPSKFGWGWVSDSISWVIPTAMAIIALERGRHLQLIQGRKVERRIALGRAMLLDRMCPGGGWNSGNGVVYGVPLAPNIEATSIALLALQGNNSREVERSLSWLLSADCESAYSTAWKILALQKHRTTQPDIARVLESSRSKLSELVKDPRQTADTCALALSVLALDPGCGNPFAAVSEAAR